MKKILILILLLLSATFFAQTVTYENLTNSILSDSSDLPIGIWNAGNSGGPVSFGLNYNDTIYFTQNNKLFKASEGSERIETSEQNFLPSVAKSFKINGDNLYIIYDLYSDFKNKISKMKMSDLNTSSSTEFSEITNGIIKFEEVNGYVFLAHNKDGTLSDKLVGRDLLNNIETEFVYTQDFRDFTVNGNYIYLIADNGTTTRTIEVVDFSNKFNVHKVGEVIVTSAVSLTYDNGYLYIPCSDNQGMKVIDVTTPTAPTNIGNYRSGEAYASYEQVFIEGTKAYLRRNNELSVLDISNPASPTKLHSNALHDLPGMFTITDVANGKVYYKYSGHFGIIETDRWVRLGQKYLSPSNVQKVKTDGTNIVIYDYSGYYFGSLTENKFSPKIYDFLAKDATPQDFSINGDFFFVSGYSKLYIHQVSNLSSTPLATYSYFGSHTASKINGNLAVVAGFITPSYDDYFEIIDLTDKSNPTRLYSGTNLTNGTINSIEFSEDKNMLYLTSVTGGKSWFTIYNITSKTSPVKVSETEITAGKDSEMEITDSTAAFVINKWSGFDYKAHLFAYDISNPTKVTLKSDIQISNNEFKDAQFIEGLLLVNVPQDLKIYTYTLIGSNGTFASGDVLELNTQLLNVSGFVDHTSSTFNTAKFNTTMGTGYERGYLYGASESEGYKIIYFKKKEKTNTKVTLQTNVLPIEAKLDGCTVSPDGGSYSRGTQLNMSATATAGWVFKFWSGDLSGSANPSNLIMDSDKNVTGNFLPILNLSMVSAPAENHNPPTNLGEEIYIATANVFVDGVDWLLQGITFTATGKAKAEYTEAYLEVKGSKVKGTIAQDGEGNIASISFTVSETIKEGETLPLKFYYKFNIPSKLDGIYAAGDLMEVKKLSVSTSISKLNCIPIPVPARPGVKLPLQEFASNTQTMAAIWNVSLTPFEPFETIQKAIDFNRTLDGHRIKITPGFYEQHDINITKELTIFGSGGKDVTYIGFKEQNQEAKILFLKKDNIKIYGLTFQEGKNAILNEKDVEIKNCEIYLNTFIDNYRGIKLVSCDSADIHDNELYTGVELGGNANKITNNRIGRIQEAYGRRIPFYGVNILKGNNNLITENQISGCINAIELSKFAGNNGIENIVENNKIGTNADGTAVSEVPIDRGIVIKANSNIVKNNLISGFKFDGINIANDNYGGWGTDVGKHNEIIDNYIGLNADGSNQILVAPATGIKFESGGDSNLVKNNTIASCGFAIYLDEYSAGNKIIENKIGTDPSGNSMRVNLSGIIMKRTKNNLIKDNVISGGASPLLLAYSNSNRIEGNKFGTDITGTKYLGNADAIVIGNESSENLFIDNTINSENKGITILGKKTEKNNIQNNRIGTDYFGIKKLNCKFGIVILEGAKSNNISDNLISGCTEVGIQISGKGTDKNLIQVNKVGVTSDGKSALPNGVGISILHGAKFNTINYNLISGNLNSAVDIGEKGTSQNIIKNNSIGSNKTKTGVVPNKAGIYIYDNASSNFVDKNMIVGNDYGVFIADDATQNSVRNNWIGTNKTGTLKLGNEIAVNMFKAYNNVIVKNQIWYNESGILDGSGKNIITGNDIAYNTGNTGIHLNNSNSLISGNNISNDETDAIKAEDGSQPTIIDNNIYDNKGYGIINTDENSIVFANGNWWGSVSGPASKTSGNVNIDNWLGEKSVFSVIITSDTIFARPDIKDSLLVFCQNRNIEDDKIDITIMGDKTDWLDNTSFTYDLSDTNSLMAVVSFTIPASATSGEISKYYVTGKSQGDPTQTVTDSFYVFVYNSQIADLIVTPKSTTLGFGDTLAFAITAFDQYKKELSENLDLTWETSTGKINSSGIFVADSTDAIAKIKVTEKSSGIYAYAEINIVSDSNAVHDIIITPDSIIVEQNNSYQFSAIAKNRNGKEISFKQVWSTNGGSIDSTGLFKAGDRLGKFSVTVTDAYSMNSSTVVVTVSSGTSVEVENIIPKHYSLNQNYPNPFNPSTTISYGLPFDSKVKVEIFNILGQRVDVIANGINSAGLHSTLWDAGHLASGIYIIRINATSVSGGNNFTKATKMILMK